VEKRSNAKGEIVRGGRTRPSEELGKRFHWEANIAFLKIKGERFHFESLFKCSFYRTYEGASGVIRGDLFNAEASRAKSEGLTGPGSRLSQ